MKKQIGPRDEVKRPRADRCTWEVHSMSRVKRKGGHQAIDMTGKRIGRWTVLGEAPKSATSNHKRWLCRCDCGTERPLKGSDLRARLHEDRSCGCFARELASARLTTHGNTNTPEFETWMSMIKRCEHPRHHAYDQYGGRGITVCKRWRESFELFLQDMCRRPSPDHSIERIDNNCGYDPSNCRWATRKDQQRNKRSNRILVFSNESLCVTEWSEKTGIPRRIIFDRLRRGWTTQQALTVPVKRTGT